MIWATIKKHGLLFWRNPSHLQLLIGLPILLIAILGFSLKGFMSGETITALDVDIALMEHGNERVQVERFIDSLDNHDLSTKEKVALKQQAEISAPITRLKQTVSDELAETVTLAGVNTGDFDQMLESEDYDALIEVPEDFTYNTLESMFLNGGDNREAQPPELQLYLTDDGSLESGVVLELLDTYKEQLALAVYSNKMGVEQDELTTALSASFGSLENVGTTEPISATTYYAIGMITMNILFVATSIAMWAFYEREGHIFNRMIISRTLRSQYVLGIFVTGMLYAFIQAIGIYCLSVLLFGVRWTDPGLFLLVTAALALTVGGLASVLASVSYRLDSLAITSLFSSFVIYMFAFVGGSFFPVKQSFEMIRTLGNFTPNGAGMTAYLSVMRGAGFSDVWPYVGSLTITAVALLVLALGIFPKRGGQV